MDISRRKWRTKQCSISSRSQCPFSAAASLLLVLITVLHSSALIPLSSPTVFNLTFSFSWPLPLRTQEPFDMWEHFLWPDISYPWLHTGGVEKGVAGGGLVRDKVREGQKERGRWETRERKKERWTERGKKRQISTRDVSLNLNFSFKELFQVLSLKNAEIKIKTYEINIPKRLIQCFCKDLHISLAKELLPFIAWY